MSDASGLPNHSSVGVGSYEDSVLVGPVTNQSPTHEDNLVNIESGIRPEAKSSGLPAPRKSAMHVKSTTAPSRRKSVGWPKRSDSCTSNPETESSVQSKKADREPEHDHPANQIRRVSTAPMSISRKTSSVTTSPQLKWFEGQISHVPNIDSARSLSDSFKLSHRASTSLSENGSFCAARSSPGTPLVRSSSTMSEGSVARRRSSLPPLRKWAVETGIPGAQISSLSSNHACSDNAKSRLAAPALTQAEVHVNAHSFMPSSWTTMIGTPLATTTEEISDGQGKAAYKASWAEITPSVQAANVSDSSLCATPPETYQSGSQSTGSPQSPWTNPFQPPLGLERVNTKLHAWSFGLPAAAPMEEPRRPSVVQLMPEINVYPDTLFTSDATLVPSFQDPDSIIPHPPPNSMRNSRMSSRRPSRPSSPPPDVQDTDGEPGQDLSSEETMNRSMLDEREPRSTIRWAAEWRARKSVSVPRKPPSLTIESMGLGAHRDSVVLAKNRLWGALYRPTED